jgi:hypothetical protein
MPRRLSVISLLSALALSGCDLFDSGGLDNIPPPPVRPAVPVPAVAAPPAPPRPAEPSETSQALSDYYAELQQGYLSQGLLREDGGGPDTPVTRRQLVENFIRIALFEEFTDIGGRLVPSEKATLLHRWEGPVRMRVEFGATVPERVVGRDEREISRFAQRLARLTGLSVTLDTRNPNFHVFILNEDERRSIGPELRKISPQIDSVAVNTVENMSIDTLCLVFSIDGEGGNEGVYEKAVAVIRAEHPDLLRLSCIHEELAQGLGLPNDSPLARPSVFNDDEEFGLLTRHDELLLRMLYDPRLQPGMSAIEVRPIAEEIAAELLGGPT